MRNKIPTSENDVKSVVSDWFKNLGGWSEAIPAGRGMGIHGISDRIGVLPVLVTPDMVGKRVGLFVAIEAKKPGRRGERFAGATKNQVEYLRNVIDHHGIGALVDSAVDLANLSSDIAFYLNAPLYKEPPWNERFEKRITGRG